MRSTGPEKVSVYAGEDPEEVTKTSGNTQTHTHTPVPAMIW